MMSLVQAEIAIGNRVYDDTFDSKGLNRTNFNSSVKGEVEMLKSIYTKMQKFFKLFTLYGLIIFTTVCIFTGLMTFCRKNDQLPHLEPYTVAAMGGGIVLFLFTLFRFYGKLYDSCSKHTVFLVRVVIVAVILAGQITCFNKMGEVALETDAFIVTDMASDMAVNTDGILDNSPNNEIMGYFARYENNHFFTIVLYWYFCILNSFLSLSTGDFVMAVQVLNIIMLDLGILLSYFAARKMKDVKTADTLLLLSALSPTTYVWIFWSYTSTYSIPFVMGILLLYLHMHDAKNTKRTLLYGIGMAVLGITGCFIRATTVIPFVAVICMQILCRRNINKTTVIRIALWSAVFFLSAVLSVSCFTSIRKLHLTDPDGHGRFPITHWIMMGLSDKGGFCKEDVHYTLQFETAKEKNEAAIRRIEERIEEKGLGGLACLATEKLWRPYGGGTDGFTTHQAFCAGKITPLFDYVYGEKNGLLFIYCNAFRLLTLSLVLVSVISFIRRNQPDSIMIYVLTLFGSMLFFLLWESNRKYGVSFQYVLLSLSAAAVTGLPFTRKLDTCCQAMCQESRTAKKASILLYGSCMVVTLLVLFLGYHNCVVKQYDYNKKIIRIKPSSKTVKNIISKNKTIEQTFFINQPFDKIKLYVREYNQSQNTELSSYQIDVFNSSGQPAAASIIVDRNTTIKNGTLNLELGNICPKEKGEEFTMRITRNSGTKDFLKFHIVRYWNEDKFRSGKLKKDKQDLKADIGMCILGKRTESLMPKWIYLTGGGMVILLELIFFVMENMCSYTIICRRLDRKRST
ncbi:MAG: hypothetical protein K2N51_07165 [Lachnospiraceae bacterium]|nr:hypothetical protein [Lachnospiraceae bacterium]